MHDHDGPDRGTLSRRRGGLLAAVATLAMLAPAAASAEPALKFFKNYFVTGDYVAAGVGLQNKGVDGIATGRITIDPGRIPDGAEIVAAYLYWQTVSTSGAPAPDALQGARFRGNDLGSLAVLLSPAGSSPCWSNGGGTGSANGSRAAWSYRADVLRFFPRRRPDRPAEPVEVQVAGSHEVQLPDSGNSSQLPSTLGAGLLIVYRLSGYDAASGYRTPRLPLRSIVIYDGGQVMNNDTRRFSVTVDGFYEAARGSPAARMTHMVANGQSNKTERVQIRSTALAADDRLVAVNPFQGDTGFDVVTFESLPLEPGAMQATVTVDPGTNGSFDCLNWETVVLSTEVQDRDLDGLLDVWESRSEWASKPGRLASVYPGWPLADPTGTPLPDLQAMGASPVTQDLFVQLDFMTGSDGHSHLPPRDALLSVASAFRAAAVRPSLVARSLCAAGAARGQCPINVHFDVGSNYQPAVAPLPGSCASTGSWTPDCAIVPAASARGGNPIREVPCSAAGTTPAGKPCAFPGYAGAVGWKSGLRAYRDAPVDRSRGAVACPPGGTGCEPRMPRNRKDIFHYALYAHALGFPSPSNPRVPRRTSGIADGGGGDLMVTFGLWESQSVSSFVHAATLMHELGHNAGLRHGGVVPSGALEPNCKPNYQSVMNYLFQVRGLLDSRGVPALDFSREHLPALAEGALSEPGGLGTQPAYLARWYAPQSTSYVDRQLNTSPATRRCDGSRLGPYDAPYVRVDADPRTGTALDWNADGRVSGTVGQDVNFDGEAGQAFSGANDYATLDLRQVGARRAVGSQSLSYSVVDPLTGTVPVPPAPAIGGGLSLDSGYGDLGYGDLGYGDLGYGDLGYGDLGYGDLGYGDLGYGDLGYGDLGAPAEDPLAPGDGDLNLETAGSLGSAPSGLTATALKGNAGIRLQWLAPHLGTAIGYEVYRVLGAAVTESNFAARALVASLPGSYTSLIDGSDALRKNATYTYFLLAVLPPSPDCTGSACQNNVRSGVSNFATVSY